MGQMATWRCSGCPMLGQNLVVRIGGVKEVHPIPHDQAGPCLLVGGLPLQHSLTVAQSALHFVHCLLYLTLQLCHCAFDPAPPMLRAATLSHAFRMQRIRGRNACLVAAKNLLLVVQHICALAMFKATYISCSSIFAAKNLLGQGIKILMFYKHLLRSHPVLVCRDETSADTRVSSTAINRHRGRPYLCSISGSYRLCSNWYVLLLGKQRADSRCSRARAAWLESLQSSMVAAACSQGTHAVCLHGMQLHDIEVHEETLMCW